MSLVPSLLQAIVHVDGEALVMHAGDKPYVVAPAGQIELASSPLALDAVSGIVAQLLPPEFQKALDEFGAVQYDLPPQPGFPRERFTVVAARGGDDVWAEIRRRRVLEDTFLDEAIAAPLEAGFEAQGRPVLESQAQPASVAAMPLSPLLAEEAAAATASLGELTERLGALDERTKGLDEIHARIQALTEAARQAEQTKDDLEQIRASTTALMQDFDRIREASRETGERAGLAADAAALLETFRAELGAVAEKTKEIETLGAQVLHLQEAVQVGELTERLGALDERTKGLDEIHTRIQALTEAARQTEETTQKAIGPDGELQKHHESVRRLSSEVLQTQAMLEMLKQESAGVEELRDHLRHAEQEVKQTLTQVDALKSDLEQIRSSAIALGQDFGRISESAQQAREGAGLQRDTTTLLGLLREEVGALAARMIEIETLGAHVGNPPGPIEPDELTQRLAVLDDRTRELDEIDKRIQALTDAARQAEQTTQNAIGLEGELQRQREAVRHLSSEVLEGQATLEAVKKEGAGLEELRGQLREAEQEVKQSLAQAGTLKNDLDRISASTTALMQDFGRISESAQQAREGAGLQRDTTTLLESLRAEVEALAARTKEIETLGAHIGNLPGASQTDELTQRLAVLDDRTRELDEIEKRIQTLTDAARQAADQTTQNAIEHEGELQKQREAVRHISSEVLQGQATLEAVKKEWKGLELRDRLGEAEQELKQTLAQAGTLQYDLHQIRVSTTVLMQDFDRIREASRVASEDAGLQKDTAAALESLRAEVRTLAARTKEIETLDERLGSLQRAVADGTGRIEAAAKDERLVALSKSVDALGKRFDTVVQQFDDVTKKQLALESLGEKLSQVDDLSHKTARQSDALNESREDLEGLRKEVHDLSAALAARVPPRTESGTRVTAAAASSSEGDALDVRGISFENERASSPPANDDLAIPHEAQLWSGPGRRDALSGGEGLEVELPDDHGARVTADVGPSSGATVKLPPQARPVPPQVPPVKPAPPSHPTQPPAPAEPESPVRWVPPPAATVPTPAAAPPAAAAPAQPVDSAPPGAPSVEPPPVRPASQPRVVLSMARNPIRGDRADGPPPLVDDTRSGLERLLRTANARGASTLYLSSDARPSIRVDGQLHILDTEPVLTSHDVVSLLLTLMPERSHEALRTGATTEWICDIEAIGRVRCMSIRDHRGPGGVFRLMPGRAVSVDQLGLSPEIQALAVEPEGVVLVAGPRSSGKRTLISALVDVINRTRHDHVITIEREINIVHTRGSSFVSQREVRGGDEELLAAARAALREDPDVLVLEQIRNGALMNVALEAAASGHLVIGGFAAHDATETIDRIIDFYAPEYHRQVQFALADNLRAVVAQVLLPKTGGGRVAARELLLNTPAVASVLAEGTTSHLPMAIEGGRRHGMVPLNDALVPLVQSGAVDVREACRHVTDRPAFLALLKRYGIDTSVVERLA